MEIDITFLGEKCKLEIPTRMFSLERSLVLSFEEIQVEMRNVDHYLGIIILNSLFKFWFFRLVCKYDANLWILLIVQRRVSLFGWI